MGGDAERAFRQATRGFAQYGIGARKDFEQNPLFFGQNVFIEAVDLAVKGLFGVDVHFGFGLKAKLVALGGLDFGFGAQSGAERFSLSAEFAVSQAGQRLFGGVNLVDVGLDLLQRAL